MRHASAAIVLESPICETILSQCDVSAAFVTACVHMRPHPLVMEGRYNFDMDSHLPKTVG